MQLITTLLAFAFAIGLLVTVHEFGHYWVARRCGVRVLSFSIGFGPTLWQRKIGDTTWKLSVLPLGGYVKMLDEREAPVAEPDLPFAFNRKPVLQRMAIVIAGPLANFLLAIVLFWTVFLAGVPVLESVVASVAVDSAAAKAGMQPGDRIVAVGERSVEDWDDLRLRVLEAATDGGNSLVIHLEREGQGGMPVELGLGSLSLEQRDASILSHLGLSPIPFLPEFESIMPDSPAAKAGLQAGDRVVSVNGKALHHWGELQFQIRQNPGRELQLGITRNGLPVQLAITPELAESGDQKVGRIGARPRVDTGLLESRRHDVRYGPISALNKSLTKTWELSRLSLEMMGKMVLGHISWKQLNGPVAMADYAGQTIQVGLLPYLEYLCLISISIAVLNLLPVPVLDGGHLMYYTAELIKGSPVSEKTMIIGQHIGLVLLGALMAFALFNDFSRLLAG